MYNLKCRLVFSVKNKKVLPDNFKINYINCKCCKNSDVKHIICNLWDTPHYQLLLGNHEIYKTYLINSGKYAGYGLEHSYENYINLINNFKLDKINNILIEKNKNNNIILDGVHRTCILIYNDIFDKKYLKYK